MVTAYAWGHHLVWPWTLENCFNTVWGFIIIFIAQWRVNDIHNNGNLIYVPLLLLVCVCDVGVISHTHTQKEMWSFARWLFSKSYETEKTSPSRDMWVWGCVCGRLPEIWQCNSSTLAPSRREMMFHIRTERYAVQLWSAGLTISMFALFHSNTRTLICHTTQRTFLLLRGCAFIALET